jgi:hypothetical protein
VAVSRFLFGIDNIGGSDGDGIDIDWDVFIDLDPNTSIFGAAQAVTDITDEAGNLKLFTEKDVDFEARYFQLYIKWNNIKYNDHPAYIKFRDIIAEIAQLSDTGVTTEEDN